MARDSALENTDYQGIQSSKATLRHLLPEEGEDEGNVRRLESCIVIVHLNIVVLFASTMEPRHTRLLCHEEAF
jgi:hypothetical protein